MDALTRISLIFRPEDIGLPDQAALASLVADLQDAAEGRVEATEEQQFQNVLADLYYMQLRKVLREPKTRKLGDVADNYDTVRLIPQLRRDWRAALVAAGLDTKTYTQRSLNVPVYGVI